MKENICLPFSDFLKWGTEWWMGINIIIVVGVRLEKGMTANGHRDFFWSDGNILNLDCGTRCTTL